MGPHRDYRRWLKFGSSTSSIRITQINTTVRWKPHNKNSFHSHAFICVSLQYDRVLYKYVRGIVQIYTK